MQDTQDAVESEGAKYLELQMESEEKKHEYKVARRPLVWFRNIVLINIVIAILAIVAWGIWVNDVYITSWCDTALWIVGLFSFGLFLHFFNVFYYISLIAEYDGEKFGFRGIDRIKHLITLKDEIATIETQLRVLKDYQTHLLTTEEQYDLYKDELLQAIREYQGKANRNRAMYFTLQIIIIACSLFVSGLTSGLTGLISIFGNHWLAPAFSFSVSFLTAMVTLFRPRERSYNLQQTADAIQYEISCANRRIYGYKGLTDREAYTRLAEEVEKLRNEQRKRQQQLEQASEVKPATSTP